MRISTSFLSSFWNSSRNYWGKKKGLKSNSLIIVLFMLFTPEFFIGLKSPMICWKENSNCLCLGHAVSPILFYGTRNWGLEGVKVRKWTEKSKIVKPQLQSNADLLRASQLASAFCHSLLQGPAQTILRVPTSIAPSAMSARSFWVNPVPIYYFVGLNCYRSVNAFEHNALVHNDKVI